MSGLDKLTLRWALVSFALLLVQVAPIHAAQAVHCGLPGIEPDGWEVAKAEEAGLDAAKLCSLSDWIDSSPPLNPHAVIIIRGGKLVFERYRAGRDVPWGNEPGQYAYDALIRHDARSISKSVVSLLVGIAIDRGLIAGLDAPLMDYLPDYPDHAADRAGITIRHLLAMRSGLWGNELVPYESPHSTERVMAQSADPYRASLEQTVAGAPDSEWSYNGGSTMLLSKALRTATGKPLLEFAREALFEPLGIVDVEWIPLRRSGEIAAYGSLRMRPRDMGKIGQLLLNRGERNGRRIVSEAWIDVSTTPVSEAWYPYGYALHWWRGKARSAAGDEVPMIMALGLGGQRIFVLPALDLVVVTTAWATTSDQLKAAQSVLDDHVLPSLMR